MRFALILAIAMLLTPAPLTARAPPACKRKR